MFAYWWKHCLTDHWIHLGVGSRYIRRSRGSGHTWRRTQMSHFQSRMSIMNICECVNLLVPLKRQYGWIVTTFFRINLFVTFAVQEVQLFIILHQNSTSCETLVHVITCELRLNTYICCRLCVHIGLLTLLFQEHINEIVRRWVHMIKTLWTQ